MTKQTSKLLLEDIIPLVVQIIRTSGALKNQDVAFNKTVEPEVKSASDEVSSKFIDLTNSLIQTVAGDSEGESVKIDSKNDLGLKSFNWDIISGVFDSVFEKTDLLLDELKHKKKDKEQDNFTYLEESTNTVKDDSGDVVKKMEKPQINFKIPVDNSESSPFKPKLITKPNALKSFEESLVLVQPPIDESTGQADPPFYPQPYSYEIDNQPYPDSILSKTEPIPSKPWESTTAEWIDKPEQVGDLVKELSNLSEIAIDLEHHDYRSYYGLVCLMQISNREKDWIVDTLALRDDLHELNTVFTNPQIVKVFHGAFMDIIWLQRDLGLYIVSLFDTYHASKKLGAPKFSLAYLLETYAKFKTSKKYQLADWRIRPLSKAMLAYARSDTHFLLNIFDHMRNSLIDKERLQDVLYESRLVAKRRFEYTTYRPLLSGKSLVSCPVMAANPKEPYMSIVNQYNIPYHISPVVKVLYEWRDRLARELDESVRYVMSNQALALLATTSRPVTGKKVIKIPTFVSESVRNHSDELAILIQETLDGLENNDWKLMDHIDNQIMDESRANIVNQKTEESIQIQNDAFESLCEENNILLSHDQNSTFEVILSTSRLFPEGIHNSLAVKFGKDRVNVSEDEIQARMAFKLDEFEKLAAASTPAISVVASSSEEAAQSENFKASAEVIETPPSRQEGGESSESAKDSIERKDDIITLRQPRKPRALRNKRHLEASNEEVFDYQKEPSLMKKSDNKPSQRNKKRKFDPYSNSSDGPRAARGHKQFHGGRTSTFK